MSVSSIIFAENCIATKANGTFTPQDFESEVIKLSLKPKVLVRGQDQWVGNVSCSNMGFEYKDKSNPNFVYRRNITEVLPIIPKDRLIIVLESPHVDEFKFYSDSPIPSFIGPANGKTGENIRKYLDSSTREFCSMKFARAPDDYALILMNAIPYQCSLGNPLSGWRNIVARKNRDLVFRACWEKAKYDFCERLSRYLTKHTLVINACTKGANKGGRRGRWLRDMVEDTIVACNIPTDYHIRRYHPSSLQNWKTGKSWVHQ